MDNAIESVAKVLLSPIFLSPVGAYSVAAAGTNCPSH